MNIFIRKDTPVKSRFLTIISHLGPTHLQRVSASLGESLWHPIYPSLLVCGAALSKEKVPIPQGLHRERSIPARNQAFEQFHAEFLTLIARRYL